MLKDMPGTQRAGSALQIGRERGCQIRRQRREIQFSERKWRLQAGWCQSTLRAVRALSSPCIPAKLCRCPRTHSAGQCRSFYDPAVLVLIQITTFLIHQGLTGHTSDFTLVTRQMHAKMHLRGW